MPTRVWVWMCGSTLLLGLAAGAFFGHDFRREVHARGNDADQDRLWQDLSRETASLQQVSQTLAKIASATNPCVVHIQSERNAARGRVEETGSGVVMTSAKREGMYVVTNRHVIDGASLDDITIQLSDGREIHPERVLTDAATDLAVLKVNAPNLTPARWADSNQVEIGHLVLAMGSPFGLSRSVTLGIISAKARRQLKLGSAEVLNQDFLQTDAAINPGNSGGPLIDLQGRVVGINTAIASSSGGNEGIGFSIPSNLAQRVMEQLLEHGVVHRAYLGVRLDPSFDLKTARQLKLDRVRGSRVTQVYPNTPAARANLQVEDVVLAFDGTDVQDENHLINLVSLTPIGRQVKLSVWRNGKEVTLTLTLANRNDLNQSSEAPLEPGMGVPVRPMGLTMHPLDGDLAQQLGFDRTTRGLLVLKVEPTSQLASSVQVYDVVESIGRRSVTSLDELESALTAADTTGSVMLQVRRTGNPQPKAHVVIWHR